MINKRTYQELKSTIQEVRKDMEILNARLNTMQNMAVLAKSEEELLSMYEKFDLEEGLKYISIWEGE